MQSKCWQGYDTKSKDIQAEPADRCVSQLLSKTWCRNCHVKMFLDLKYFPTTAHYPNGSMHQKCKTKEMTNTNFYRTLYSNL